LSTSLGHHTYLDKAGTLEPNQSLERGAANAGVSCAVEQAAQLVEGPGAADIF
jgi:hypothetical protein